MARYRRGQADDDSEVSPMMRLLMFFFNTIFWFVGAFLVAVGVWAFAEKNRFGLDGGINFNSLQARYVNVFSVVFDLSILVVVLGMIVFILAFAGCIGALRENICLLKTFAYIMGALLLIEIVLAFLAFLFSREIKSKAVEILQTKGLIHYRDDDDFRNLIDWAQQTFQCCGVDGYRDWSYNPYFNCTLTNPSYEKCSVPYSCCVVPNDVQETLINTRCGYRMQELSESNAEGKIFTVGCIPAALSMTAQNLYIVGGVAIGLATVQVIGILTAMALSRQISGDV